jgi:hypothetical protein
MTSEITLFLVAAPPRSGTQWYSQLFTTERSYCYHELTSLLRPYPTNWVAVDRLFTELAGQAFDHRQRRMLLEVFPEYFRRHWERTHFGQHVVGNSDAGALTLAAGIWLLWPSTKFLYSSRNGINVVESTVQSEPRGPAAVTVRAGADEFFDAVCERWARTTLHMGQRKAWLEEQGAKVLETRLEKITTDVQELRRVWEWLIGNWDAYAERNRALMTQPANVRTNVKRIWSAEEIWETWTQAQRASFTTHCADAQTNLGYGLPAT